MSSDPFASLDEDPEDHDDKGLAWAPLVAGSIALAGFLAIPILGVFDHEKSSQWADFINSDATEVSLTGGAAPPIREGGTGPKASEGSGAAKAKATPTAPQIQAPEPASSIAVVESKPPVKTAEADPQTIALEAVPQTRVAETAPKATTSAPAPAAKPYEFTAADQKAVDEALSGLGVEAPSHILGNGAPKGRTSRARGREVFLGEEVKSSPVHGISATKSRHILPLSKPEVKEVASVSSPAVFHEVAIKPGDTLYGIARDHGSTPEIIASANGMKTGDALQPGRILRVPERPAMAPSQASRQPTTGLPGPAVLPRATNPLDRYSHAIAYRVQSVDNIHRIADAHATTAQELIELNGRHEIRHGEMIVVPVDNCLIKNTK